MLSIVAARIVAFFVKRMRKRADALVANQQRASQLRTMSSILRATSYAVIGFYLLTTVPGGDRRLARAVYCFGGRNRGSAFPLGAQSIFKDMLTGIFIPHRGTSTTWAIR